MQQAAAMMPQPGIAIPTTLASNQVQTVSYPAPRTQMQQQQQQQGAGAKQRVFTGTVTKLHDNFGFVDEDVFFQTRSIANPFLFLNILVSNDTAVCSWQSSCALCYICCAFLQNNVLNATHVIPRF